MIFFINNFNYTIDINILTLFIVIPIKFKKIINCWRFVETQPIGVFIFAITYTCICNISAKNRNAALFYCILFSATGQTIYHCFNLSCIVYLAFIFAKIFNLLFNKKVWSNVSSLKRYIQIYVNEIKDNIYIPR